MRVTQALSQSHRVTRRLPALALAGLALALGGCASNTTLGEKSNQVQATGVATDANQGAQTTTITKFQKFMWFFSPYRPDIQQGNFVSEEMLTQLKTGMTRDQVKFIFGTALLTDPFHADRWDYPFRLARGNGETTTSRVVVFFKDGKVDHWEGGNLPTEKEYIARIAGPAPKIKKEGAPDLQPAPKTAPLPAGVDSSPAQPVDVSIKKNTN
ncbi:outer membrane protein assembly factor BamE [Oxalobacteraceae bacterium A2-2]